MFGSSGTRVAKNKGGVKVEAISRCDVGKSGDLEEESAVVEGLKHGSGHLVQASAWKGGKGVHNELVLGSHGRVSKGGSFQCQGCLRECLPSVLHPSMGSQMGSLFVGQEPKVGRGAKVGLYDLHVLNLKVVGWRVSGAVAEDGLEVFNQLDQVGVFDVKALGPERAVDKLPWKFLLYME